MARGRQPKYKAEDFENKRVEFDDNYVKKFLADWDEVRDRHSSQLEVHKTLLIDKKKYVFLQAGRKFAKTDTAIDDAWYLANCHPNSVIYLCYPSIAAGIEVVWEERRLQTCDLKEDYMLEKYVEKVDDNRHMVRFVNGSFIKLTGTWTESRGRGTQPDFIIYDEFQDCNPDYIEAMDSNLSAKPHAQCLIMGTPPKKANHYEEWIKRVESNPDGKHFKFTSYSNDKLPHLKDWLDKKKIELIKAGKEDVWQREYMAELCYSSSDRVLPDITFWDHLDVQSQAMLFAYPERIPIMAVSCHASYFCCIFAVMLRNKKIFVFDAIVTKQVWNQSWEKIYPTLGEKAKFITDFCFKKIRKLVWDESRAFADVVPGFETCRKDVKWQDRGIPLLREMILNEKIVFSREVADLGVECQNMLIEESEKDIQKNYPMVCTLAMMANEYFSQDKLTIPFTKPFDKWDAFREMGIPVPKQTRKSKFFRLP